MSYSCFQKVIHVGWCECDKHGLIFQQHIDILLHLIQYLIYRPSNYDYMRWRCHFKWDDISIYSYLYMLPLPLFHRLISCATGKAGHLTRTMENSGCYPEVRHTCSDCREPGTVWYFLYLKISPVVSSIFNNQIFLAVTKLNLPENLMTLKSWLKSYLFFIYFICRDCRYTKWLSKEFWFFWILGIFLWSIVNSG